MKEIVLKKGRAKTARQFHPWIFSGAISKTDANIAAGEIVRVLDSRREFVAYGYCNPASQIALRLLEWDEDRSMGERWWCDRIARAIAGRKNLLDDKTSNCCRLVFGESDGLPGLMVDKYENQLILQSSTAGIDRAINAITAALVELLKPATIYERSHVDIRKLEGLPGRVGGLHGEPPPERLIVTANDLKFYVDVKTGHKTGLYLDQRFNHRLVAAQAENLELLDCFCYTGAFSLHGIKAGAKSAVLVDSSAEFLAAARDNFKLNGLDGGKVEYIKGDVFTVLREFADSDRRFDMVILDPPKFAASRANLKRALAGYKDLNLQAMKLLKPGGLLATFSCSGAVTEADLKTVLFWAALDAGKQVQILQTLYQGPDHPRSIYFPEAEYLKGFLCRVI